MDQWCWTTQPGLMQLFLFPCVHVEHVFWNKNTVLVKGQRKVWERDYGNKETKEKNIVRGLALCPTTLFPLPLAILALIWERRPVKLKTDKSSLKNNKPRRNCHWDYSDGMVSHHPFFRSKITNPFSPPGLLPPFWSWLAPLLHAPLGLQGPCG